LKTWLALLVSLLVAAGGLRAEGESPRLTEEELGDLYVKATMLLAVGDYDGADQAVRQLRAQLPTEPKLIHLERQIQLARETATQTRPEKQLEQRLARMILPKVNFRNAQPETIVDWLRQASAKLSADKLPVNMVWMVPPDATLPGVTLNLQDIPLLDVLRYTAQAARLKVRVEPHAVVIALPEPVTAAQPDDQSQPE
jgi:uncharacterized protein HemY